mmetsp:Transcript_430/g.911  ORF Transcript_430/g.911 Transcript_430/m.911 type:complete len:477 (+) Transcript_430:296-1726(+)
MHARDHDTGAGTCPAQHAAGSLVAREGLLLDGRLRRGAVGARLAHAGELRLGRRGPPLHLGGVLLCLAQGARHHIHVELQVPDGVLVLRQSRRGGLVLLLRGQLQRLGHLELVPQLPPLRPPLRQLRRIRGQHFGRAIHRRDDAGNLLAVGLRHPPRRPRLAARRLAVGGQGVLRVEAGRLRCLNGLRGRGLGGLHPARGPLRRGRGGVRAGHGARLRARGPRFRGLSPVEVNALEALLVRCAEPPLMLPLPLRLGPDCQVGVLRVVGRDAAVPVLFPERHQPFKVLVPLPLRQRLPLEPDAPELLQAVGGHLALADALLLVDDPVSQLWVLGEVLRHVAVAVLLAVGLQALELVVPDELCLRLPLEPELAQLGHAVLEQLPLPAAVALLVHPAAQGRVGRVIPRDLAVAEPLLVLLQLIELLEPLLVEVLLVVARGLRLPRACEALGRRSRAVGECVVPLPACLANRSTAVLRAA